MPPTLEELVLSHPENAAVLTFLGHPTTLVAAADLHPLGRAQECARYLFDVMGERLEETAKRSFGGIHPALVHPVTGVVFGIGWGRFTLLLRYAEPRSGSKLQTFDGTVDIGALGRRWGTWWGEDDEALLEIARAYEAAGACDTD